jgi:hypothetical protein
MTRFLVLAGLHFLLTFALLPDNVVVGHPIHHDDYANLATGVRDANLRGVRPVSTIVIAAVADLGPQFAYAAQNLLVLLCLWLALRFVELFVRDGRPLPLAGYASAAIIALAFPPIVDWTRYFGLLTNLSSASFGLAAMATMAWMAQRPARFAALALPLLVLVALSVLAKEDFALPMLLTAATIAATGGGRRWVLATGGVGALFALTLLYNRAVGSVFVSGTRAPGDPYYMDFSPLSLWATFARMLLEPRYSRTLLWITLAVAAVAIVRAFPRRTPALRLVALPAIALSVLAPYAIFPNHAYVYYAFLPVTMLACALAAGAYAALEPARA